jgi:DNA repair protein RecN (Recombination protein N)
MLRRLSIRNIVLIDALDLEFDAGLGAMTGETGAGKSILLDALGAALGARASADLVRVGADKGSATAEFEVDDDHPVWAWLREQGHEMEDDTLIVRRVLSREGRSRAYLNDTPVGVAMLRELGSRLIEIHGQFDDRALVDPAGHRGLLDAYGGLQTEHRKVAALYAAWREQANALEATRAEVAEAQRDAEFVKHSVEELAALAPEEGEEDVLDAERRQMQRAESIADDVSKAIAQLGNHGAEAAIGDAMRRVEVAAGKADGRLDEALAAIGRALNACSDALSEAERAAEALSFDPRRLEEAEERLFALRALARKHRIGVSDLPGLHEGLGEKLAFIERGEEKLAEMEGEVTATHAAFLTAAKALSRARQEAGAVLDAQVVGELAPLKLDRAIFRTLVESDPERAGPDGIDRGPIDKIASGGELSRFLLALKVCLAQKGDGKTLIFDEIDRGVGGATAAAIGARLKRLGADTQTLVITHAPQVAAEADRQWRIEKSVVQGEDGETTLTRVVELSKTERVDELARMLAGESVTKAAKDAARSLLKAAS